MVIESLWTSSPICACRQDHLCRLGAHDIIPILRGRNGGQLEDNLAAADVKLATDQIRRLDDVSAVALGFPHDLLAKEPFPQRLFGGKLEVLDLPTTSVA